MIRILLTCALCASSLLGISQSHCSRFEYVHIMTHTWGVYQQSYQLVLNSYHSYYTEININPGSEKVEKKVEETDGYNSGTLEIETVRKNMTPKYYYNGPQGFYFRDNHEDHLLTVKESEFPLEWKIQNEFKDIGSFTCQKAQLNFRGRFYTAWFTADIPTAFGPWKFRGLPGLILDISDETGMFRIAATKIKLNAQRGCEVPDFKKDHANAMSINEYVKEKKRLTQVEFARITSRFLPEDAPPMKVADDCEECNSSKIEIFDGYN